MQWKSFMAFCAFRIEIMLEWIVVCLLEHRTSTFDRKSFKLGKWIGKGRTGR